MHFFAPRRLAQKKTTGRALITGSVIFYFSTYNPMTWIFMFFKIWHMLRAFAITDYEIMMVKTDKEYNVVKSKYITYTLFIVD